MKIIEPIDIQATDGGGSTSYLSATSIAVDADSAVYGAAWAGAWASGTTYAEGKVVYQGSYLYESLTGSNTGNNPTTTNNEVSDTPKWLILGAINRWRMFDGKIGSYAESATAATSSVPSTITFSVVFRKSISHVSMFGVDGQTVEMSITGTDWNYTRNLIEDPIRDWSEYFFNELVVPISDFSQPTRLELSGTFNVTITNNTEGQKARCGLFVIGRSAYIGSTKYGIGSGILDFSRKAKDDFGRTFLKEGEFVKLMKCSLFVPAPEYDIVQQTLSKYRAKAIVWDANQKETDYSSFVVYGFPRDFRLVMNNYGIAECSLDIEGLT